MAHDNVAPTMEAFARFLEKLEAHKKAEEWDRVIPAVGRELCRLLGLKSPNEVKKLRVSGHRGKAGGRRPRRDVAPLPANHGDRAPEGDLRHHHSQGSRSWRQRLVSDCPAPAPRRPKPRGDDPVRRTRALGRDAPRFDRRSFPPKNPRCPHARIRPPWAPPYRSGTQSCPRYLPMNAQAS